MTPPPVETTANSVLRALRELVAPSIAEARRQYSASVAALQVHEEALGDRNPLLYDSPSLYMVTWYDHPANTARREAFTNVVTTGRDVIRIARSALRNPSAGASQVLRDAEARFAEAFSIWSDSTTVEGSTNTDTFRHALDACAITGWERDQLELLTKGALRLETGTQDLSDLMVL